MLASGSSGNCIYIGSGQTGLLVDAGLSARETLRRMEQLQLDPSRIRGICVSHEHKDHTAGLRVLQRRHGYELFANAGTIEALARDPEMQDIEWQVFSTGFAFSLGDLTIEPFAVPHDAYEPVGFVISSDRDRVGIATDIGIATGLVRQRLKGCRVLLVESNHDERLLQAAARPWHLKQRIAGRQGHLSNTSAAELVCELAGPELEQVYLVHLSEECNRHDLAMKTARQILDKAGHTRVRVSLTFPDRVSDIWRAG